MKDQAYSHRRPNLVRTLRKDFGGILAPLMVLATLCTSGHAQAPTPASSATTLAITSGGNSVTTVASFRVVTLTATVTANGAPVTPGTVNFCASTKPSCYGAALLGTAQLTAAGTASLSFRPAQGSHSYKAIFLGTANNATSTSPVQSLTVSAPATPQLPTYTALTNSGTTGNYTLTATVTGNGNEPLSSNVSFTDHYDTGSLLTTEPLTASQTSQGFMLLPSQSNVQSGTALAAGDFNNDGLLDVLTQFSNGVGLQLGNGDLTFKSAAAILPGGGPLALGDFNSDGNLDLALIASGGVQIYLGDGTGNLTALPAGPALTAGPLAMSTVDLNHDGILDLVVQDYEYTQIFLGVGDGTFTKGSTFDITQAGGPGTGNNVTSMVTGDFNADGIPDIAAAWVTFSDGTNTLFPVTFLFGDGTGNFTSNAIYPDLGAYSNPNSFLATPNSTLLTTTDINNDGKQDVVAAWGYTTCCPESRSQGTIDFINNGDGTLTPSGIAAGPAFAGAPVAVAVVDPVGDGSSAIAVEYGEYQSTGVPGEPPNLPPAIVFSLGAPTAYLPDNFSGGFVPGDFDGDGVQEIATATNSTTSIVGFQINATATANNIALPHAGTGTHNVDATYAPDSFHTSSTSPPISLDSGTATVTIQLSVNPTTAAHGTEVDFTATVTSTGFVPSGQVNFLDGAKLIVGTQLSNGVAVFHDSNLPLGSNSITAVYQGDTNNPAGATSQPVIVTITQASPTLTLTASPNSAAYGTPVQLTATFSGASTTPTGSVSFLAGSTSLGSAPINASGVATLSASTLPVGQNSITASYIGDSNNGSVTSAPAIVTITKTAPTLTLTASPTLVAYGGTVTLTAKLSGLTIIPTGNITFQGQSGSQGSSGSLGTASLDQTGTATLTTSTLSVGQNSITASFAGDTNDASATSSAVTITITKDAPTLSLSAAPASAPYGMAITLTAKFTGAVAVPTGNITFQTQSATLGSVALDKTGAASLALPSLAAGFQSITATFAGDTNNVAVTSSPLIVPVNPTVIATSALSTIYAGLADTITVTLGTGTNTAVPTGTITLKSGSYTSAATPFSAGSATISIPANTLSAGSDTIAALYSGDATYPASSGQVGVAVSTAAPPGFTISAPTLSVAPGATSGNTVTVTLTPVTGFTGNVALSAQITASPGGATDLPTVSFGSTSTVAITGNSAATATLTINTSPVVTSRNDAKPVPGTHSFLAMGGAALACVLMWGIPRRELHRLLKRSRSRWLVLAFAVTLLSVALSGCGGHTRKITDPGTTPGAYTITVTGTSGAISESGTVTLTVQ